MPEPKPLGFKPVPAPQQVPADAGPKPLGFKPAPPASTTLNDHAAPRALGLAPPAPAPTIEVHEIGQPVRHMPLNPPPRPVARDTPVLGGNPKAPALVEKAKLIDPEAGNDVRMRGRIELFLDLAPSAWVTWAEKDLRVLVDSASKQAEYARQLSLANAVKWASECEQAYAKPPGLLERFTAPKPEFYRERLTQARDVLQSVQTKVDALVQDMRPRMKTIRLDAVALQVCTADVTEQSQQITATRRLQTMVQAQQTGAMILQAADNLGGIIANQAATVSDLLTLTIPNWIMAQSK